MYFEIYRKGKLIKRGNRTLEPISFELELMYVPIYNLVLPVTWLQYFNGREEVKLFINNKCFWGIVWDLEVDKTEETLTVSIRHAVSEWEYRQISVNNAQSDKSLNIIYKKDENGTPSTEPSVVEQLENIYKDTNFAYPGWNIDFQDDVGSTKIDYVYSRQNKLEALTQTMELTQDIWWRVGWWNEKKIQIGRFGEKKPYIFSTKPSGKTNIRIIAEPTIDYDFENVINVASVYSDKSDSGMASLTLREIYNNPSLQDPNFPVIILRKGVNNERDYTGYNAPNQPMRIAPNNELEFAVLDNESIALESGTLIEGTFAFNDLNPFQVDSEKITDAKRLQAAKTVYDASKRRLIQARRSYDVQIQTGEIPYDLLPGDMVRLLYDNRIWNLDACSNYWKKILSYNDWFYVTRINYEIDETGVETNTLTLTKWIKTERETSLGN